MSKITFPHSFGSAAWIALGALCMALGFAAPVALKTCEVDHGNIVLEDNGKRTTLTNSGLDSDPSITLDDRKVVFARSDALEPFRRSIYQVDIASKVETLLYAGSAMIKGLEDVPLGDPALDAAGETLYAVADTGVTFGRLVAIDLRTKAAREITDAVYFGIIRSGPNAGRLLVSRRRMDILGFPYNVYWLYSPDGRDLGMAGPDQLDFRMALDPVGFGEAPSQPDTAKPARPRRIAGIGEKKLEHVDPQLLGEHRLRTVDPVDPRPPSGRGGQDQVLVFAVVIDEEGRVSDAQFISGNPLLVEAARAALAQWRFKPFLFDGRPAAVAAQISVRFPAK